jgi:hypothetical protein
MRVNLTIVAHARKPIGVGPGHVPHDASNGSADTLERHIKGHEARIPDCSSAAKTMVGDGPVNAWCEDQPSPMLGDRQPPNVLSSGRRGEHSTSLDENVLVLCLTHGQRALVSHVTDHEVKANRAR